MSYKVHSRVPASNESAALMATASPSSSNPIVTVQDSRLVANGGVSAAVAAAAAFGSGRDGNLTFDGSAVTGFDLTGTDYIRNLAYDLHANTITVSNGYAIDMAGTRLRAFSAILGNSVQIHNNAMYSNIQATASSYWFLGGLPDLPPTTTGGAVFIGGNGGQAPNITITDTTGGIGSIRSYRGLLTGGSSGPGGAANANATRANPTLTNHMTTLSDHFYGDLLEIILGSFPYARNDTGIIALSGGLGGGRGYFFPGSASNDTACPGGGGGGGVLGIAIKELTCGTGCIFSANGGSCANSFSTLTGANTSIPSLIGGCSGGGGGAIAVLIGQITGSNVPTIEAKGGNGGNGAFTLGTTTNTDTYFVEGGCGGDGGKAIVYIGTNYVGSSITVNVNGGTKGNGQSGSTPSWSANNADGVTGLYYLYQTGS